MGILPQEMRSKFLVLNTKTGISLYLLINYLISKKRKKNEDDRT